MGEARGIEVETRDEKSEAEKEELATTGGRSLSSVTRLQLPRRTG